MPKRVVKYNPAFLTPAELVESFVVRHDELELIVQILRENDTQSNQHVLVIGPRGIGKTMLVLRVALEVRRDEHLRDRWYPLVFAEESYQVQTPGEFWLEALFHLRRQTGDDRWKRAHDELVQERDEERLCQRALSQLVDFADSQGKRILLVVENFNMLLGDQISSDDAWVLRHTLQNESRIMLLATATTRFEEVENAGKAMFDLFKLHELPPLDEAGCRAIWARTTGQEHDDDRIRPIQILTGGNPRLLTIISAFAARLSFEKLMTDLIQLVDDHTEYFKSHLDNLAPVERKVYLALAEIWDPATAREVAQAARLDVSKTSSLLGRLTDRDAVAVYGQQGRTKSYQVAERMYNIYYLMRRRGAPSKRVKGLVDFMVAFYGPEQLVSLAQSIAKEACQLEPESRQDHYQTYAGLMEHPSTRPLRDKFLEQTPREFFLSPDVPGPLRQFYQQRQAAAVGGESDLPKTRAERLGLLEKARKNVFSASVTWEEWDRQRFWHVLGGLPSFTPEEKVEITADLDDYTESQLKALAEVLENGSREWEEIVASGDVAAQLYDAVRNGYMLGPDDVEGAEAAAANIDAPEVTAVALAFRFAREPSVARSEALRAILPSSPSPFLWCWWADGASKMGHEYYEEAEAAYRKAIELKADYPFAWGQLGRLLHVRLGRYEEADAAYRKVIELKADSAWPWAQLGKLLHDHLERYEEAETAYKKVVELKPDDAWAWARRFILRLEKLGGPEEAFKLAEECLATLPGNPGVLNVFAWELYSHGQRAFLPQAEAWARKAVAMAPENGYCPGTLASILCAVGKEAEALEHARAYLEDTAAVQRTVDDAINLFVDLAAGGRGSEALELLRKSPSAELLEPLVVGLELLVGEEPRAATEIMEVAGDVLERIQHRRDELLALRKGSDASSNE